MGPWGSKSRQQKSQRKGNMRTVESTGTKNVSHHNVTAWRRATGGCISWSSFQSQYGRQITATADFCPVFVKVACAPLLLSTANWGSHWGTSLEGRPASFPSCLFPRTPSAVSPVAPSLLALTVFLWLCHGPLSCLEQGVLLKWSESSTKTHSTAINSVQFSWFLL